MVMVITDTLLLLGTKRKESAVQEFLPFLCNAYLHHLGIDLQNAKPTSPQMALLDGVVTWFRHHPCRVTKYSLESNGEHEEVASFYQELTHQLLRHVQAALQNTFRGGMLDYYKPDPLVLAIVHNTLLQNQLKENTEFLKEIKRKFRNPSSDTQLHHLDVACEHLLSDLENLAGEMHVEGNCKFWNYVCFVD